MTTETLTELLGWVTVVNFALLVFSTIMLILLRGWVSNIHSRMFGLGEQDISRAYFQYLAQYKIAILMLNLTPYIALKIIQ